MLVTLGVVFLLISFSKSDMESKIVGGRYSKVKNFPYMVYLVIGCQQNHFTPVSLYSCSASILNQEILLTAGHCLIDCSMKSYVVVNVGNSNNKKGDHYDASSYLVHPEFDESSVRNDIALVALEKSLKFGNTVSRISLMKEPPYREKAVIAGWGLIDEITKEISIRLKDIDQYVLHKQNCMKILHDLPKGTFCAKNNDDKKYASEGDSGGPLVVRGYIQIGLVSYKVPEVSRNIIIYTDTGYFYDWITKTAKLLLCDMC